ncbi:NAD(P)-dependent dehydrogenase (short-subunit alcohol dehydrogenase family) [Mycobacteroides chelonae]|nr:NAD(P)-dependent dehydrogenase (short-subunit alcohol dehydrogenase family) [Mycobacteroides chelonae]
MSEHWTVLVTGASSGIGASAARIFVERGHRVFGTSRNPDSIADRIAGVQYLRLDQTDKASIAECVAQAGEVDILVNNAGESQIGALEDISIDDFEKLYTTNVFGPVALTKAVLPGMRERRRGAIVMVGSMAGTLHVPFRSAYSSAKSALRTVADCLRYEVAPLGITVSTVEPGVIATGIEMRRNRIVAEGSAYREAFQTVDAAMAAREQHGMATDDLARLVVDVALNPNPKPLYAKGSNAPLIMAAQRLLPARFFLKFLARMHGLKVA